MATKFFIELNDEILDLLVRAYNGDIYSSARIGSALRHRFSMCRPEEPIKGEFKVTITWVTRFKEGIVKRLGEIPRPFIENQTMMVLECLEWAGFYTDLSMIGMLDIRKGEFDVSCICIEFDEM